MPSGELPASSHGVGAAADEEELPDDARQLSPE